MGLREAFFPSGELEITENGTYNVKEKESVNVSVSGGGGQPTNGKYLVQFLGINEVIQTGRYNTGDVVTLPTAPTYEGMVFQSWSSPVDITDNTVTVGNSDLTLGAVYATASGATEIDITLTPVTGLNFGAGSFNNMTSIDWGDGSTSTALGSHTYSNYGDYTVKVYASGGIDDSRESNMFGGDNDYPNYTARAVRFGNLITSIGKGVFSSCYSLTSVTIPDSVTSIGDQAFYSCNSLTSVTIPDSVTSIGSSAFIYCPSLTSVTIPDSVTSIGSSAFSSCYSLTSVTIPDSVTSIGNGVFTTCRSLTSVTIPASVTSIEGSTFYGCNSLTSMTIPSGVTGIEGNAFAYCDSIVKYDFTAYAQSDSVPTLSNIYVFSDINAICKMYFRDQATLDNFASATNWSAYADYMYIKEN